MLTRSGTTTVRTQVLCVTQSVAGLSTWRHRFDARPVHVGFMLHASGIEMGFSPRTSVSATQSLICHRNCPLHVFRTSTLNTASHFHGAADGIREVEGPRII